MAVIKKFSKKRKRTVLTSLFPPVHLPGSAKSRPGEL
jgi:hypothetical protein